MGKEKVFNCYLINFESVDQYILSSGTGPIKILQHKFYATQFFKHFDWLKIFRIQSEFLKNCVV